MEEKRSPPVKFLFAQPLTNWREKLEDNRASRAVLRRCATLDAVTLSDAYQRFYRYMLACGWPENSSEWQRDKLAAIAGLVAHVKMKDGNQGDFDDTQRLPIRMYESKGDRPLVSEIRFRDLLKVETTDDLFTSLRRILPLGGHQANIERLAHDVYGWNDDIKKLWAYSYRWPVKKSA
jgi:CRISPR system Cascade subunit CasB